MEIYFQCKTVVHLVDFFSMKMNRVKFAIFFTHTHTHARARAQRERERERGRGREREIEFYIYIYIYIYIEPIVARFTPDSKIELVELMQIFALKLNL